MYIAEDHKEELIVEKGDSLVEVAKRFIKEHRNHFVNIDINEEKL